MKHYNNLQKYGKWALITGASSGIGEEFARVLAFNGFNLVLVARREERLNVLKNELESKYKVNIRVVPADLSKPDFMDSIITNTSDIEISVLINNAGYGSTGEFVTNDPEFEAGMVLVNCYAPVKLTHHFGNKMKEQGMGAIMFLGSVVAFQPVPMMSVYSATKAFNLLFGEGLSYELKKHNIDTLVINPGTTDTEFQRIANIDSGPLVRTTKQVVDTTLSSLAKKTSVVDGLMNKITAFSGRLLPRKLLTNIAGSMAEKMYKAGK